MKGEFKRLNPLQVSSLREGFFSRRSNLTTIATSVRIKIASCLAMTTFLGRSVNGSLSKDNSDIMLSVGVSPTEIENYLVGFGIGK
ncbi:hypothetical protein QFZ20_003133 [Flavobacterium sp. W4I14]|nr:hypothetical protein [Flavobacterium sp. W4I14]